MDPEERRVKRSYRTLVSRNEKLYMGVAVGEALIILAIAATAFGVIEANVEGSGSKEKTVSVYLAVFIVAQIFSLLYVFDALRARNVIQLLLHLVFQLCIFVYSILQIPQISSALGSLPSDACGSFKSCTGPGSLFALVKELFIVTPVILGLCTTVFGVLTTRLYVEFGWAIFHLVGASPAMKRMHRDYQTFLSLLKLLLFFALAFCLAYLVLVTSLSSNRAEFIITIIALPLAVVCTFVCGWALRAENKPTMAACLVIMVAGLVYYIYKLASMWLPRTAWLYANTRITMALFSVFAIIILVVTFIYGCLCMSNFGKGLKQAHYNPENKTSLLALMANARYQEQVRAELSTAGASKDPRGSGIADDPERLVID